MRISPTKLMHGLLYTAPILLLTLAACGGGGGGSTTTPPPVLTTYTIGGTVTGLTGGTLVLRNNGGDDKTLTSANSSYSFSTPIASGGSYNVTVLTQPASVPLNCTVNASGTGLSANVTNANVVCVAAHTIGGTITGLASNGLVLQNNLGDNLLAASGVASFTFNTPLVQGNNYDITILKQPSTQTCSFTSLPASGVVGTVNVSEPMTCTTTPPSTPPDRFVYTANYNATSISAFTAPASGVASTFINTETVETNPSSIAVDAAGHYAYETNYGANNIRVSRIEAGPSPVAGTLTHIDADGSIATFQDAITTGAGPIAIAIHPSGKFAYAVNQISNSVSGYTIDPLSGALSGIDLNGSASGTTIATRTSPFSIAITPDGQYAYVANAIETDSAICASGCGSVSTYSVDTTTGALTPITSIAAGKTSYSVAVDPSGQYAYVANGAGGTGNNGDVWVYTIAGGTLTATGTPVLAGIGPRAVTTDPSGKYVYVVNGGSNDISAYAISGPALTRINCSTYTGSGAVCNSQNFLAGTGPIAISIDSSGQYVYVANSGDNTVSAYSINGAGALIPVGSAINTGANPHAVTTAR